MTVAMAIALAACAPMEAPVATKPAGTPRPDTNATPAVRPGPTSLAVAPATAARDDQATGPILVMSRSGGLAGVNERWEVYTDGRVVAATGAVRRVPAESVAALLRELDAQGFFTIERPGGLPQPCPDCFTYEIVVYRDGKPSKVVVIPEAPETSESARRIVETLNRFLSTS